MACILHPDLMCSAGFQPKLHQCISLCIALEGLEMRDRLLRIFFNHRHTDTILWMPADRHINGAAIIFHNAFYQCFILTCNGVRLQLIKSVLMGCIIFRHHQKSEVSYRSGE